MLHRLGEGAAQILVIFHVIPFSLLLFLAELGVSSVRTIFLLNPLSSFWQLLVWIFDRVILDANAHILFCASSLCN